MANRALIHAAAIAGVTLDSVGDTVFDLFDDTNMIVLTVLHIELPLLIPIEEDNHPWRDLHGVIRPLPHS